MAESICYGRGFESNFGRNVGPTFAEDVFECLPVRREGVGVEGHEHQSQQQRIGRQMLPGFRQGDTAGLLLRKPIRAGADGGKGHGGEFLFFGDFKTAAVGFCQQVRFAAPSAVPDRPNRVNYVPCGKAMSSGQTGAPGWASVEGPAFLYQTGAGGPMDRPVDHAAAEQGGVGGVDDGIHFERGDVALDDFYPRTHE